LVLLFVVNAVYVTIGAAKDAKIVVVSVVKN